MIKSLADLKRALQPGAVVTMMASESHPNTRLIGVPRTVVKADAEKVGFDTAHADGTHDITYLHWPKDDAVEFIEDGFGFIAHGVTYWIDKEADEVADSSTKTAAVMVTCPNGHRNPEGQHFCGECGVRIVKGPDKSAAKLLALAQEAEAEADKAEARAKAIHTARTTSAGQLVTTPSPPGWYPDPSGSGGQRYWDGRAWHDAIPAPVKPPGRVNWPGLIAVGVGLVLVLIVVGTVFHGGSKSTSSMADWAKGMSPPMDQLSAAYGDVEDGIRGVMSRGDFASLNAACRTLDAAQSTVRSHLPAPDRGLDANMQEIVNNIHSAAAMCSDFGPYTTDREISEVSAQLNKASGQMESATRMLKNMS